MSLVPLLRAKSQEKVVVFKAPWNKAKHVIGACKCRFPHSSAALAALKSTLRSSTCNMKDRISYGMRGQSDKQQETKKNTIFVSFI